MSTILQVQQSLQKCSENAFHSLYSSEESQVHHTKEQHDDDDFGEFCHALYSWAAAH
jgi:hypothetical protein